MVEGEGWCAGDTAGSKWTKPDNILDLGTREKVKFMFKSLEIAEPGNI